MRQILSTALVALIVGSLAGVTVSVMAQEPDPVSPVAASATDADTVDGRHAVGAGASISARSNKLVATNRAGFLPGNIVKPAWKLIQGKPAGFADGVDDGITGITLTTVSSEVPATGPQGMTGQATVSCPAGKVTGGGFFQSFTNLMVTHSQPSGAGNSWRVIWTNTTPTNTTVTVYAICLTTTPSTTISSAKVRR
jgi:hypothetical protein